MGQPVRAGSVRRRSGLTPGARRVATLGGNGGAPAYALAAVLGVVGLKAIVVVAVSAVWVLVLCVYLVFLVKVLGTGPS